MTASADTGLLLDSRRTYTVEQFANLDLQSMHNIALIACSSGRANPFVGNVTMAHAVAIAGASFVAYSYWPISQARGRVVAEDLLSKVAIRSSLPAIIGAQVDPSTPGTAAFSVMRP